MHHREPVNAHPGWVSSSAAALRMEPLDYCASATPSVLARGCGARARGARAALRSGRARASSGSATMTPGLRRHLTTWRGRLLAALPWTEYQLYETFLVRTGRFDEYHCYSDDPLMFGNCVWRAREFEDWDPTADDGGPSALLQRGPGVGGHRGGRDRGQARARGHPPRARLIADASARCASCRSSPTPTGAAPRCSRSTSRAS